MVMAMTSKIKKYRVMGLTTVVVIIQGNDVDADDHNNDNGSKLRQKITVPRWMSVPRQKQRQKSTVMRILTIPKPIHMALRLMDIMPRLKNMVTMLKNNQRQKSMILQVLRLMSTPRQLKK